MSLYLEILGDKDTAEAKLIGAVELGRLKSKSANDEGQTPLMVAVNNKFSEQTVVRLIELGCDVNAQNSNEEDLSTAL